MSKKHFMISAMVVVLMLVLSACQSMQEKVEGNWIATEESALVSGNITGAEMYLNQNGTVEVSIISDVISYGTTKSQTETTNGQWEIDDEGIFTISFDEQIMNAVFNKSGTVWLEDGKIYVEISPGGSSESLMAFVFEKDE